MRRLHIGEPFDSVATWGPVSFIAIWHPAYFLRNQASLKDAYKKQLQAVKNLVQLRLYDHPRT